MIHKYFIGTNLQATTGMIIRKKSHLAKFLAKMLESKKPRVAIVSTKVLQQELKKKSTHHTLWLTPERLDYQLRFRTESVLVYPEVLIIGTDVLNDQYRGPKLEFSLLRIHLYNPLVKILPIKIINENILLEETFRNKRLSLRTLEEIYYDKILPQRVGLTFLIVETRKDIISWCSVLEKFCIEPFIITNSFPTRLAQKILIAAKKKRSPLITTKDLAFKFACSKDKLFVLPPSHSQNDRSHETRTFNYGDMCLLLAFEGRINNKHAVIKILSEFYSCENIIQDVIDELIALNILRVFPSGVMVPTFLGKTIVRTFLSLETSKRILNTNSFKSNDEVYRLIFTLSEFSREKLLKDIMDQSSHSLTVKYALELDIFRKVLWLLRGISTILQAQKRANDVQLFRKISNEIQNERLFRLRMIHKKVGG
ncbi:MAG: hypothetical protein QW228_05035 [Candidatus Aenigmatarchaeota archaeon]